MFSRDRLWKRWNTRYAGKAAGSFRNGYVAVQLHGEKLSAHRIIWKMVTGEEPDEIDHEDGDGGNNRWRNLKDGTHADNMKNMRRSSRNTSGAVGVAWHKDRRAWQAYITVPPRRRLYLGLYQNIEDAVCARKMAEEKYGFHKNHGRVVLTNPTA